MKNILIEEMRLRSAAVDFQNGTVGTIIAGVLIIKKKTHHLKWQLIELWLSSG